MVAPRQKSFCVLEYHTSKSVVTVQRAFRAKYAKNPPTWPHWPKGTNHCNSEEYRCTYVDACVARTWISYRCAPFYPVVHTSNTPVVKKKTFSVFLWLWTIPLRYVLWFSCYIENYCCLHIFYMRYQNFCKFLSLKLH